MGCSMKQPAACSALVSNAGSVDRNKIGYGLGGVESNPKLEPDVGVFQSFLGTVNVEDSESEQIAIEVDIATQSTTVYPDQIRR